MLPCSVQGIEIMPVNSKKELKHFIEFPWSVYQDNSYWVPPLLSDRKSFFDPQKNPFYKHGEAQLFLAYHGNKPAGTIAAAINYTHNEIHQDKTGFFGFFECINNYDVAAALFNAASSWLKKKGMNIMRGPMNFTIHDPCGLLIDGFDLSPTLMMPYNHQYYVDFFDRFGFYKASDLFSYRTDKVSKNLSKACENSLEEEPGIRLIKASRSYFMKVMSGFKNVYNESMVNNWGYIPFTDEEFYYTTRNLKPVIDPDLTCVAEYNGKVAGYVLALPDYNVILRKLNGRIFPWLPFVFLLNRKKMETVRVIALAVKEEFRGTLLTALLYLQPIATALNKGYNNVEASWIHEDNTKMIKALERMEFKKCCTYRIYDYSIP